ncbi:carbohydrate esterase family 5 protein [Daldinia sp. EC12]|nr:carbohydrate esterase family 5 protein [Daldinia sp. EC12]
MDKQMSAFTYSRILQSGSNSLVVIRPLGFGLEKGAMARHEKGITTENVTSLRATRLNEADQTFTDTRLAGQGDAANPAAGGNAYGSSVTQGIKAVVDQVSAFTRKCPDTAVVVVGYSQGAQIMDDAFCGGPDGSSLSGTAAPLLPADVGKHVKAIIFMGDPRNVPGLSYNAGTAKAGGFAARPSGYQCPVYADRIKSYCDAEDPYCSNGNNAQHHQQYVQIYGQQALAFVRQKVGSV